MTRATDTIELLLQAKGDFSGVQKNIKDVSKQLTTFEDKLSASMTKYTTTKDKHAKASHARWMRNYNARATALREELALLKKQAAAVALVATKTKSLVTRSQVQTGPGSTAKTNFNAEARLLEIQKQKTLAIQRVAQANTYLTGTYNKQLAMQNASRRANKFAFDAITAEVTVVNKNTKAVERNTKAKRKSQGFMGFGTGNSRVGTGARPGFLDTLRGRIGDENVGSTFGHKAATTLQYATAGAGIYKVVEGFQAATAAALEFDLVQKRLQAVLSSGNSILDPQQAYRMAVGLEKISVAFGGTITEINAAALALGRAGVVNEDLVKGTEQVVKLALLTGDTIADTTSVLSTFRQTYGDAAGSVKELADMLAYAANQSRLSTQDLGTLSNYALSAARATGMTAEQVLAMSTAFSNAGVNASTIGTQIRKFAIMLRQTSPKISKFYDTLGLRQSELLHMFQSGEQDEAFRKIVETIAGASTKAYNAATSDLDIRQRDTIDKFRLTADKMLGHLNDYQSGVADGMTDNAKTIAISYTKAIERIRNSVLTLTSAEITGALDSVFGTITDAGINNTARKFNATLQALGTTLVVTTTAFTAYKIALLAASGASIVAGNATFGLLRKVVALKAAVAIFVGVTGGAILAIGALVTAMTAANAIKNDRLLARAEILDRVKENALAAAAAEEKLQKAMWGTPESTVTTLLNSLEKYQKQLADVNKQLEFQPDNKSLLLAKNVYEQYIKGFKQGLASLDAAKKKSADTKFSPISDSEVKQLRAMGGILTSFERDVRQSELPKLLDRITESVRQQSSFLKDLYGGALSIDMDKIFGDVDAVTARYRIEEKIYKLEKERSTAGAERTQEIDRELGSLREFQTKYEQIGKLLDLTGKLKQQDRKDNLVAFRQQADAIKKSEDFFEVEQKHTLGKIGRLDVLNIKLAFQKRKLQEIQDLEVGGKGQLTKEDKDKEVRAATQAQRQAQFEIDRELHNMGLKSYEDYLSAKVKMYSTYAEKAARSKGKADGFLDRWKGTGVIGDGTGVVSGPSPTTARLDWKDSPEAMQMMKTRKQKELALQDLLEHHKINKLEYEERMIAFDKALMAQQGDPRAIASGAAPSVANQAKVEYDNKLALLEAHYAKERALMIINGATKVELQTQQNEHQMNIDKAFAQMRLTQVAAVTGDVVSIIDNLQKSGVVKSKTLFKSMQALQVASTLISTYKSAQLAYESAFLPIPGPWSPALGAVSAAAAIAAGMANVAQIKAQTFHTGGTVGPTGNKLRSDEIPAVLQTGERVLSRNEVAQSKQAPAQANETVIINSIDPSVMEEWATSRSGRKVIQNLVKN